MPTSRFAETSEEERGEKIASIMSSKFNNKKTLKANKGAARIFKDYLTEKGQSEHFEEFDCAKLDEMLGRFYMDLRREDGTPYKNNTLETIRYGLNRYLKSPPFNRKIDILKDSSFIDSNTCFKSVIAEAKRMGAGVVVHHPVISDADLKLLYTSTQLSIATPMGLFNKVQFDIRMYFCQRGNENLHAMTKDMFKVVKNKGTGEIFVRRVDDDDKETTPRMMPEVKESIYCPVLSFQRYLAKLHPDCDKLWQRPRDVFSDSDSTWYCNIPVGEKKLSKFLSTLSRATNLSKVYTNQSIRVTDASKLSQCMFGHSHVTPVTGNQPMQNLIVFQQVSDAEEIQTGDPSCPVSSFKKYSSKLHPDNPNFWQRPKKKFNKVKDTDEEWYDKVSVGKNALYAFMSNLSEEANLSQRYTNHCIRATSISTLDSQGVEAEDIIGISGHKHIRSVKSYNSNLDDQKKREMSDILCQNLPSNSAKTGRLDTASSSLSHTNSCTASVKEDHFAGMNEYRNLLVGDAASAWKRLVGRFYWLNDSDIAKHLIEVHDCYCGGSCPLERTHDEPNSGPQSSSKTHDLIPSTETDKDNRDVLLQLEVDEGAESIDEDLSGDSDLEHDEEFDIKQEQESVDDDTPPTSPESAYPRDDPLAPSTSSQASDAGGDNLTHTLTAVKQEPVETYSMKPAPETATADKSWPPKNAINTGSENTSNLPSSSLSSVTSNIALKSTAQTNPVIPIALIQNILQKSGRTTSNVRPPPLNTVTPSVRGVHPLLNTVTSSVRDVHPPLNTATSSVRDVHPPFSQNSAVTQNVAVTPSANIVRAQLPPLNTAVVGNAGNLPQSIPYYTIQRGNTLYLQQAPNPRVLQQAPTQHVLQQAPTPHFVQQASTSQSPAQTFLNVISCQNATLPLPQGVDFQSLSQVSQGLPVAAPNFGTLQSIDPLSVQPVCATTASGTTLQRGEQQCYKDDKQLDWGQGQKDKKNETSLGNALAMEGNFTSRESVKRPLSESDDGPGTSKRLVTIKEEKDSDA
ncbi:uncharacterized protein LOC133198711 isoform X2 [Saccostrea echinata]|uniref:uncharacterized protein LOC133198711 isoform X2 n=1 Tax=Saccostrea echinata TaxID=191078 RepID=UPI002A83CB3B|nr:uncharacterized protein LOC133198711 isoform X2 [Saccostrea echinata]